MTLFSPLTVIKFYKVRLFPPKSCISIFTWAMKSCNYHGPSTCSCIVDELLGNTYYMFRIIYIFTVIAWNDQYMRWAFSYWHYSCLFSHHCSNYPYLWMPSNYFFPCHRHWCPSRLFNKLRTINTWIVLTPWVVLMKVGWNFFLSRRSQSLCF